MSNKISIRHISGNGRVFWITGLSGAGKSSLCKGLVEHLRGLNHSIVMLDGDELRELMGTGEDYSREARLQLAMRYSHMCQILASQGVNVAIATISMFREVHEWNRANLTGYIEIFLDVPLAELTRRDPKQIYARAAKGEIMNIAGVDIPVDEPQFPDIRLKWESGLTTEVMLSQMIMQLSLEK